MSAVRQGKGMAVVGLRKGRCDCETPKPAIIGGNGFWLVPYVCRRCRRIIKRAKA